MNEVLRPAPLIRIVDDDPEVAEGLAFLLECADMQCRVYDSAESFLAQDNPSVPGCILLDIRMPGMSGLALQQVLRAKGLVNQPIIFITGHGDIEMAVDALKAGAFDFLVKPVKEEKLLPAIREAVALSNRLFDGKPSENEIAGRLSTLSARERLIVRLVGENLGTKDVAERLGISPRTVQAHRYGIYRKLGLNSVEELRELARHLESEDAPAAQPKQQAQKRTLASMPSEVRAPEIGKQ